MTCCARTPCSPLQNTPGFSPSRGAAPHCHKEWHTLPHWHHSPIPEKGIPMQTGGYLNPWGNSITAIIPQIKTLPILTTDDEVLITLDSCSWTAPAVQGHWSSPLYSREARCSTSKMVGKKSYKLNYSISIWYALFVILHWTEDWLLSLWMAVKYLWWNNWKALQRSISIQRSFLRGLLLKESQKQLHWFADEMTGKTFSNTVRYLYCLRFKDCAELIFSKLPWKTI